LKPPPTLEELTVTLDAHQEGAMLSDTELLVHVYDCFNARDMKAVLATMHEDVVWANGLESGHVYGHTGVRDCWTRQWAAIDSHTEPLGFSIGAASRSS
jgi:ketosteroid isomerase-like protein